MGKLDNVVERKGSKSLINRNSLRENRMIVIMIITVLLMTLVTKGMFLKPTNLMNLLSQNAIIGILAIAQTLVVLTGEIDLSVGAILAATSLSYVLYQDLGVGLSILLSVITGVVFGLFNGLCVTKLKINSFIVTLATMEIARGVGYTLVKGQPIYDIKPEFLTIGEMKIMGMYVQNYAWIVICVLVWLFLYRTKWGVEIYSVGGNEQASRLSGVKTDYTKIMVFVLSGIICALAGVLYTARLANGDPSAGGSYNLDSIAAVVLGGTLLSGGEGKLSNTIIGVLIFGMLNNFMNLIGIPAYLQQGVKGCIIVATVYFNVMNYRGKSQSK